ncbi:MAG TPA: hypothetical protein VMD09_14140 [Solirubrobacteraceae bacterium]|nr:hypothetical protein [Solirubrobacteraceae bacterium]
MNALVIGLARRARRSGPACALAVAVLLTAGAYRGDAQVSVRPLANRTFTLSLTPSAVTLRPGSSTRLTAVIHRGRLTGPVKLKLATKPPKGLTARFALVKARAKLSAFSLRVTSRMRTGRYVLKVSATVRHRTRTTKLIVTVALPAKSGTGAGGSPSGTGTGTGTGTGAGSLANSATGSGSGSGEVGVPFSITGNAPATLEPGMMEPLDLQIQNPNSSSLTLSSLTAAVTSVSAPQATPSLPCTASDFSMQQYSGLLPLVVAPNTTVTLSQLGVPQSEWPEVSMLDRTSNQDGCEGASLSLSYGGAASLG